MKRLAVLAAPLALFACDRAPSPANRSSANQTAAADATVTATANAATPAAGAIAIDVPGFKAKVDIPNLNVSGGTGDAIDGVPLYPGTRISGASVFAGDSGDNGQATIRYAVAATPETVLAYYRDHAARAGYRLGKASADSLSATRANGDGFTIVAHASADGTTEGTLTASGR